MNDKALEIKMGYVCTECETENTHKFVIDLDDEPGTKYEFSCKGCGLENEMIAREIQMLSDKIHKGEEPCKDCGKIHPNPEFDKEEAIRFADGLIDQATTIGNAEQVLGQIGFLQVTGTRLLASLCANEVMNGGDFDEAMHKMMRNIRGQTNQLVEFFKDPKNKDRVGKVDIDLEKGMDNA